MPARPASVMRPAFVMQWGAEVTTPGEARFRLWAPDVAELRLHCNGDSLPMMRGAAGWFELTTDRVQPGGDYAFELPDGRRVPAPAARAQAAHRDRPSLPCS